MIQVRVGQDDGVQLFGIEREVFPVHRAQVLVSLEQAAIDQHLPTFVGNERF